MAITLDECCASASRLAQLLCELEHAHYHGDKLREIDAARRLEESGIQVIFDRFRYQRSPEAVSRNGI